MEATALHKLMPRPDMSNHIQYFSFFEILFKSAKQLKPFFAQADKIIRDNNFAGNFNQL